MHTFEHTIDYAVRGWSCNSKEIHPLCVTLWADNKGKGSQRCFYNYYAVNHFHAWENTGFLVFDSNHRELWELWHLFRKSNWKILFHIDSHFWHAFKKWSDDTTYIKSHRFQKCEKSLLQDVGLLSVITPCCELQSLYFYATLTRDKDTEWHWLKMLLGTFRSPSWTFTGTTATRMWLTSQARKTSVGQSWWPSKSSAVLLSTSRSVIDMKNCSPSSSVFLIWSKTHKRLKRTLSIGQDETKCTQVNN